jgi:hypothetical protein
MISSQPNPYANGHTPQQQQHTYSLQNAPVVIETVHLYVPNAIIGAIIGTKGLFIKSIMKNSNAMVKVNVCRSVLFLKHEQRSLRRSIHQTPKKSRARPLIGK